MEAEFGFILWSLREYQFKMACAGFFVRGGLTIGPLFMDDFSVYGPALLEAYDLETRVAVNPVVVLSDEASKLVDKHLTYYMGERAPQMQDLLRRPDGRYFINYLAEAILEHRDGETLATGAVRLHKRRVVAALKQSKANPRVFDKFAWLAAYHNHFCQSVSALPGYEPNLAISPAVFALELREIGPIR